LSALQAIAFQPAAHAAVDAAALPTLDIPTHRLVFVNGRFAPGLSRLRELPHQALVASLGQALLTHPEIVEPHLDRLPGLTNHPFAALNSAFWEDGAFVRLPHETVVDAPIHVVFHATGDDNAVHPRLLLLLEDGAQAMVVVEYRGTGRYLNAPMTEMQLGQGAVLNYHQIQEESPQAFHLGGIRVRQDRDSQTNLHLLSIGGQLARTDLDAVLDGEGVSCALNGLTLARNKQFSDYHVRIEHAQAHGTSEQLFKSILDDQAQTVFDGMIHVRQHAQKTDARQLNRNLLLSKQAHANANPRLEILADDVKCGHGSSTGFLNSDAEFYLRARGIPAAQARALLVYAFANDSLNRIRLTPLRERLSRLLTDRLALDITEES
ncbi:MAG: Fe-S cluster assembly protein SufD, partial [Candidatus Competibacteraceae bacterium]|nr:Fe-S cluster assembly protein SufD [Candidatus Competibacteraceae bacterium]